MHTVLSDAEKKVLRTLYFAGSLSPSELEARYGSKYVYDVVGKLIDTGFVVKKGETCALSGMGVEKASTLVREDEEFAQRLTDYLFRRISPVASKYGLKNLSPGLGRLYVETGLRFAEGSRLSNVLDASEAVRDVWSKGSKDRGLKEHLLWAFARETLTAYEGGDELSKMLLASAFTPMISDLTSYSRHPKVWRVKRLLEWVGRLMIRYAVTLGLIFFVILVGITIYISMFWLPRALGF